MLQPDRVWPSQWHKGKDECKKASLLLNIVTRQSVGPPKKEKRENVYQYREDESKCSFGLQEIKKNSKKLRVKEDTKAMDTKWLIILHDIVWYCLSPTYGYSQLNCFLYFENRNDYYSPNKNPWTGYFSDSFLKVYSVWKINIPGFYHQKDINKYKEHY